jgi:hypothetical protein
VRTYRRDDLEASRREWADGEFSEAWEPYRKLAAESGFIYPPEGTKWDSWEDDEPSQRALLYRAIEDTPKLLRRAIAQSRNWSQVLTIVLRERDRMRDDADLADKDDGWERQDEPDGKQATSIIGAILGRIRESLP